MNVIIANKYASMLQEIGIEVSKRLEGEYEVDEIIHNFKNFYFNKMILDITSLKNYQDIEILQKLSVSLDMDKIILLLDDSSSNDEFISNIISIGIYNFTKNVEGILYLYKHPNIYRDVAHLHHLDKEKVDDDKQSFIQHNIFVNNTQEKEPVNFKGPKSIGFVNVTEHAGATTLIYIIKKELEKFYTVVGIEIDKKDFKYFNDKDLISVDSNDVGNMVAKNTDKDVILVDLNKDSKVMDLCKEVIYLFEPSIIKLNKLVFSSSKILDNLKNKKLILNKSMLNSKDIIDFEYESRLKVYFNLPPLNDRESHNKEVISFLIKLGFIKLKNSVNNR